jgi:hypothetical protein
MKSFMICTPLLNIKGTRKEERPGRGCDMYGGEQKRIYGFYGETRREEIT